MKRLLLLLALASNLLLLSTQSAMQAPPGPSDLTARWRGRYVWLTWTQTSSANYTCLFKQPRGGPVQLITCEDTLAGRRRVILPYLTGSTDESFFPHAYDEYWVVEWWRLTTGTEGPAYSNRAMIAQWLYAPRISRDGGTVLLPLVWYDQSFVPYLPPIIPTIIGRP